MRFKRKPNEEIIFSTELEGLPEIVPILKGKSALPEWFLNAPLRRPTEEKTQFGTIKSCPGIVDFFNRMYVIPMWCDLYLNIRDDGSFDWKTPDKVYQCDGHPPWQFSDYLPSQAKEQIKATVKLICPWKIRTPKGVSMLQLPVTYHFNSDFSVLPGIIETDKWFECNQQLLLNKTGEIVIKRGTPLSMYMPVPTISKYSHVSREQTEEDRKLWQRSKINLLSTFNKRFRNMVDIKK